MICLLVLVIAAERDTPLLVLRFVIRHSSTSQWPKRLPPTFLKRCASRNLLTVFSTPRLVNPKTLAISSSPPSSSQHNTRCVA